MILALGLVVFMLVSFRLDVLKTGLETKLALVQPIFVPKKAARNGNEERWAERDLKDYAVIANRDLFGIKKTSPATRSTVQEKEIVIDAMPLASLKLKLMGTVVVSKPGMSRAIIAEANGHNEQMYREGESVKGVRIKKILRNAVIVYTRKRDEVLKMDTGEHPSWGKKMAEPIRPGRFRPMPILPKQNSTLQ